LMRKIRSWSGRAHGLVGAVDFLDRDPDIGLGLSQKAFVLGLRLGKQGVALAHLAAANAAFDDGEAEDKKGLPARGWHGQRFRILKEGLHLAVQAGREVGPTVLANLLRRRGARLGSYDVL